MDAMKLPANSRCSVARSLEVLGQKWTLLIVRDVFRGFTRFAEFRTRLGIPSDVLTARLEVLVAEGILERRPYQQPGERSREKYVLTETGRALIPVLAAFSEWGDTYRPTGYGPASVYVDADDRPVRVAFIDPEGAEVDPSAVRPISGPGSLLATA